MVGSPSISAHAVLMNSPWCFSYAGLFTVFCEQTSSHRLLPLDPSRLDVGYLPSIWLPNHRILGAVPCRPSQVPTSACGVWPPSRHPPAPSTSLPGRQLSGIIQCVACCVDFLHSAWHISNSPMFLCIPVLGSFLILSRAALSDVLYVVYPFTG